MALMPGSNLYAGPVIIFLNSTLPISHTPFLELVFGVIQYNAKPRGFKQFIFQSIPDALYNIAIEKDCK